MSLKSVTYRDAGVDIDAGNSLVETIKPFAKKTNRAGVLGGLGGFGGLFDLKATGYKDPILVSGTDGVGTKLLIAIETGFFSTIGQDLVAMCVNDVIVQGAEPLFFLDYFATGQLNIESASTVIRSIAEACTASGCALLGGETAEMPGFYQKGHFDLAGFCVGAVERSALLPRTHDFEEGDVVVGVASSGPHSNGYSLLRRLVADAGLQWTDTAPWDCHKSIAESLLTPTALYVRPSLDALKQVSGVRGLCHITGGGLTENLPRVLPSAFAFEIQTQSWPMPSWCQWAKKQGHLSQEELLKTFNAGLGLVVVVSSDQVEKVQSIYQIAGHTTFIVGSVIQKEGESQVIYV